MYYQHLVYDELRIKPKALYILGKQSIAIHSPTKLVPYYNPNNPLRRHKTWLFIATAVDRAAMVLCIRKLNSKPHRVATGVR